FPHFLLLHFCILLYSIYNGETLHTFFSAHSVIFLNSRNLLLGKQEGIHMSMKKTLTLAGSDSSGGAGIQADLKTFQEHSVYGMTALTSIVTMDPKNNWSHGVYPIDAAIVSKQLDTILSIGIDAMKTGMLGSVDIIELGAQKMDEYKLDKFVLDPVMVCKGEDEVLQPENTDAMRELLLPRATLTTPNLFEAGQLAQNGPIKTMDD